MSTTPTVDQTVQRDQILTPDQADLPGSPKTLDREGTNNNEVAKDGFTAPLEPDTPDAAAEILALTSSLSLSPSILHLSDSSSSPHASINEDSPREASSSDYSDYDFESSDEEYETVQRDDDHGKVATSEEDDNQNDQSTTATRGWQYQFFRTKADTCLGAGWSPGDPLPNRTYANEYIAVRQSALQGHGVFAAADIKEGTEVLMEAPLLRARSLERLGKKHARLGDEERAVYDGLVGYHEWETCPVRQKWSANSFDLAAGYNAVFAIASNFNHACKGRRNTKYDWDQRKQVMTFEVMRDIEKGEELLVSYCNYRHILKEVYGFVCHCGSCEHQAIDL